MILLCGFSFAKEHQGVKPNSKSSNEVNQIQEEEPPEGYYAFVESPNAEPPKVKPPPYIDSDKECHGTFELYNLEICKTKILLFS